MYPQVFGKYVLERELAMGGMARVVLATLRGAGGFEKKLVVKQIRDELALDQEFIARFVEEAKTTVALSHPNIVPVYELGIELGTYFLAMELVSGVSVDQLLRGEGGAKLTLSPEEGAYVGVEVCRALDYAHRRMQVIHRDITPRNVMVDEEGQVKLIDFGIAARTSVAGQDVFGTPGHMPPEQLRREEIGPATDLFAVAVLLMELWSGHPPFRRKTPAESLAQMHAPHPKPSETDLRLAPLDAVIGSAMSLSAADRPQQADDLGRALRKFLQDTDLVDVQRGLGARVKEAQRRAEEKRTRRRADGSLVKPSKPSIPDMGPKTFAMREEAKAWKPEVPDESGGTRRLPGSEPPPPLAQEEPPKIETVATRPIETPVRPETEPKPAKAKPGWVWPVAVAAAVAVLVPAIRFATSEGSDAPKTPRTDDVVPSAPSVSRALPPPTAASVSAPAAPTPTPKPLPPPVSPTVSAEPPAKAGQLFLVGDPGTEVSVDDSPPRSCPAAVSVKAGSHLIRFTFGYATAHDSVGRQVAVGAGERVTVRADFTTATPRIRIEK